MKWKHEYHFPSGEGSRCKHHPKYKVMLKPRTPCHRCWALWIERSTCSTLGMEALESIEKNLTDFQRACYDKPIWS